MSARDSISRRLGTGLLALGLWLATVPGPVAAEPPEIRFEAGADVLIIDRTGIESAEIPEGHTAYISGNQDVVPLLIEVTPEKALALNALTSRHLGETIFILVDGALVSRPIVREATTGNALIITNIDRNVAAALIAAVQAPAAQ